MSSENEQLNIEEISKENISNQIIKKTLASEKEHELILKYLNDSINSSLLNLELNSTKNENSLKSISKDINDYNEELKILIKNIDEHIKKKEEGKQKEKEKDGGLENLKEKEKFRKIIIQNKSNIRKQNIKKDSLKKKRKNNSINEISNNTISNINTTDNSKKIEERVKRLNKFKNVSKKTESNVRKTNSISIPIQTKKSKEKIEGRNKSNINEKDKTFISDVYNNKTKKIISKDNSNNNINKSSNKKKIHSKSFLLNPLQNSEEVRNKNTSNKKNKNKEIKSVLFKRIQKELIKIDKVAQKNDKIKEKNNDKKIDKINNKKIEKINDKKIDKKIENKKEKKIIQKELSPKKILTTNNSQKEIAKIEKIKKQDTVIELKIKEQEETIEKQKETISKLIEELKIYKDNDTRNGIFVIKQNKTLNISENYITINDEIVILVKGAPLEYTDTYSYTMEVEIDKLKSKEIYIDNKKINVNEYEIIDNRYIKLHFEKTFNNEKRKIKVIQVIPHEFQFYSYYDLNLTRNNVLTKYIISHDDNIKIDDITNEYFKRNESLNLIYFEGKTTNEMIEKPGSIFFSKKILYSIYNYIPEFKSKEDNIIKMKESNNKIAVNILARYKKVIITNYGQEVEDIYKIKISNYETKVYCVNLNYPLILNKRYEVNLVELNGQKVEYSAKDSSITILKFGAFNNQFAEVHFKYKYFKDDKDIFRQETIITNNIKILIIN